MGQALISHHPTTASPHLPASSLQHSSSTHLPSSLKHTSSTHIFNFLPQTPILNSFFKPPSLNTHYQNCIKRKITLICLSKRPHEIVLTIADQLPTASVGHLHATCDSLHMGLSHILTSRITTECLEVSILFHGIQENFLPTVHLALTHKAQWHTYTTPGNCYSAIIKACKLGHLTIIVAVIAHYGPTILTDKGIDDACCCNQSPLSYALNNNDLALTTLLLQSGIPGHWPAAWWILDQPLTLAAKFGSPAIAQVLVMGRTVR